MKQTLKLTGLSLLSSLLLFLAWPAQDYSYLLFIALSPLLFIEYILNKNQKNNSWKFIGLCYLAFLLWNASTTYWLCFATLEGGLGAIILNALLMCVPLFLFYRTKSYLGNKIGYASLIFYWLGFEYLHLNWELSWTWLNLGNGLSTLPELIQWYEYTGVLGGSAWVWAINICIFLSAKSYLSGNKKKTIKYALSTSLIFFIPVIFSFIIKPTFSNNETIEVVIVQPNIDPYYEKYGSMSYSEQVERMIQLSDSMISSKTELLVWPETAILYVDMDRLNSEYLIRKIRKFLNKHPQLSLVSGIVGNRFYKSKKTITAQKYGNGGYYYDEYNAAIMLDSSLNIPSYHKSKLVPLVENLPYQSILGKMAIDLGGTVGSLVKSKERVVFKTPKVGVAPIICYESIYGSFVSEFVERGAELLLIVTNDAWWYYPENGIGEMIGSEQGHLQHFSYGRLRAIESRKAIARSANTGISGFIYPDGSIKEQTKYWEKDVRKATLPIVKGSTFYHKHGDYIGRISGILSLFILLVIMVSKGTERYKYRKN